MYRTAIVQSAQFHARFTGSENDAGRLVMEDFFASKERLAVIICNCSDASKITREPWACPGRPFRGVRCVRRTVICSAKWPGHFEGGGFNPEPVECPAPRSAY